MAPPKPREVEQKIVMVVQILTLSVVFCSFCFCFVWVFLIEVLYIRTWLRIGKWVMPGIGHHDSYSSPTPSKGGMSMPVSVSPLSSSPNRSVMCLISESGIWKASAFPGPGVSLSSASVREDFTRPKNHWLILTGSWSDRGNGGELSETWSDWRHGTWSDWRCGSWLAGTWSSWRHGTWSDWRHGSRLSKTPSNWRHWSHQLQEIWGNYCYASHCLWLA